MLAGKVCFRPFTVIRQHSTSVTALIMGPPGGGKGTISKKLIKDFGFHHISTGDVLRAHVNSGTQLGKEAAGYMNDGALVPDELIIALVREETNKTKANDGESNRVLLDGFPRTQPQAEALDLAGIAVDIALNLEVPYADIVERASNRWIHPGSGRVYATDYNPPKAAGKDDETGEPLVQREDDKPDTVRSRLAAYDKLTAPLCQHYAAQGVYCSFTGSSQPELLAADRRSDAIYCELKPHIEAELGNIE